VYPEPLYSTQVFKYSPVITFKTERRIENQIPLLFCNVVYYESIKQELKRRLTYEYRCDERLKTKKEESTRPHRHWVGRVPGTLKEKDEVNRREVCECEGYSIGTPSILRLIREEQPW
jgi:hypothetical protein